MLYYDHIDVSKEINIDKTSDLHSCKTCIYNYYLI